MLLENERLIEEAKTIIIQNNKVSTSLLQRTLQIGYARAALILDILEEQGFIGKSNGAKPREIINNMSTKTWQDNFFKTLFLIFCLSLIILICK